MTKKMTRKRSVKDIKEELERSEAEKKILSLRKTALSKKIDTLTAELQNACTHKTLKEESRYCPGSYDERASTFYWNVCTTCGKKFDQHEITHGYYG